MVDPMSCQKLVSLLLLLHLASASFASTEIASPRTWRRQSSLLNREQQIGQVALHDSKFSTIPHVSTTAGCGATSFPEPIATPNLLLDRGSQNIKISVSFIIGTDGRVHSPLILEGAGRPEDGNALNTVRTWRYRPATCNGVPTEAEATIQFSIR
jgi:TonB family protein